MDLNFDYTQYILITSSILISYEVIHATHFKNLRK